MSGRSLTPSPLRAREEYELLEEIPTAEICRQYKENLRIDVARLFGDANHICYCEGKESGIRFFDPAIIGDDRFYGELSVHDWYYSGNKYEYRYVAELLSDAGTVLDVGCGAGRFADSLGPKTRFVGLECSSKAQSQAVVGGRTVLSETVEQHALHAANAYDAVTAFQVLEHVADPESFLRAMFACARPGAIVAVSVPADDGFMGIAVNQALNMPPHHVTRWSDTALTRVLCRIGVEDIRLHHEPLQRIHEREYLVQLIARAIGGRDFHQRLIRTSFRDRVVLYLSSLGARFLWAGIVSERPLVRGHTVIAIGRKNG